MIQKKIKIEQRPDCKLIPSNILKAFMKTKKQKTEKKIANASKLKTLS